MVSIKLVWDGGIIKHAQNATNTYTVEQEKELINLGYSEYQMGKYSKTETTEDFETLREYFIGKDINNLIDEEKSTDEKFIFTNGSTISAGDYEEINDTKVLYNIYYNGYYYRLILDGNTGIGESLEVKNKNLTIEGTTVDGNEKNGWTITFNNTKHAYELSGIGNVVDISNKWWEFRGTEEDELKPYTDEHGLFTIAKGSSEVYRLLVSNEGITCDYITLGTREYSFIILLNDDTVKIITENTGNTGNTMQKLKWYFCPADKNVLYEGVEYTGECPIKVTDFTDEQIHSRTYLERLINSFNK